MKPGWQVRPEHPNGTYLQVSMMPVKAHIAQAKRELESGFCQSEAGNHSPRPT